MIKKFTSIFFIGVFYTLSGMVFGQQWQRLDIEGLQIVISHGTTLFTNNYQTYPARSSNGGVSWTPITTLANGTLVKGKNNNKIYYFIGKYLLESSDNGTSWDTVNTRFLQDRGSEDGTYYFYETIGAMVPVNEYYAIKKIMEYNYDAPGYEERIMVIDKNGTLISSPFFSNDYNCHIGSSNRLFEPDLYSDGKVLYNVYLQNESCEHLPIDLVLSYDNGITFHHQPLSSLLPSGYSFRGFLDDGKNIYMQAVSGTGAARLFLITPNAATKKATLAEIQRNGLPSSVINVLARVDDALFAAIGNALYRSNDNGATWQAYGTTGASVTSIAKAGNYLFAGTYNGLFRTPYLNPGLRVSDFTLVDAQTDRDLRTLRSSDTLYTDQEVNIRANVFGAAGSVRFFWNGSLHRTENTAPYSFAADNNGDYAVWNPVKGNHQLRVVAYSGPNGSGTASVPLTLNLVVLAPEDTVRGMRFVLVDAEADRDLRPLKDGETIHYDPSEAQITLRALPDKIVKSIVFKINGMVSITESAAPYALKGDLTGDFVPWNVSDGTYRVEAIAYAESGGKGSIVERGAIRVTITTTGAVSLSSKGITSYPNPVRAKVRLSVRNEGSIACRLQIYDLAGNEYYSGSHWLINDELEIDLEAMLMQPGMYLIKVETEKGVSIGRIQKDK